MKGGERHDFKKIMEAVSKLIYAFLTLIVGIVLLTTTAGQGNLITSKTVITNETQAIDAAISGGTTDVSYPFNVTNFPTGWKTDECPLTDIAIVNATNVALVRDTHYTFYPANGSWTLKGASTNTSKFWENNNSYVTYTYCGNDYLNSGFGRTAISTSFGLFAIALMMTAVALFFSVAKDYDII